MTLSNDFEFHKTINKLNLNFERDLCKLRFTNRPVTEKYKMSMIIPEFNQVSFGKKRLKIFGHKLWISLPYHIKSSENAESLKSIIKRWNGEHCLCNIALVNKLIFHIIRYIISLKVVLNIYY